MTIDVITSGDIRVSIEVRQNRLPIYSKGEQYFVEGDPGYAYVIRVVSTSERRQEILTSVDGRNTMRDEQASWDNRGMIIGRYGVYLCQGWRINLERTHEFIFGDPSASIAAQATGSAEGVGVIGVAAFRERVYRELPKVYHRSGYGDDFQVKSFSRSAGTALSSFSGADLGTEMGREQEDRVGTTSFERESPFPAAVVEIQYRTRQWLIDNGIIAPATKYPSAFPGSFSGYEKYAK